MKGLSFSSYLKLFLIRWSHNATFISKSYTSGVYPLPQSPHCYYTILSLSLFKHLKPLRLILSLLFFSLFFTLKAPSPPPVPSIPPMHTTTPFPEDCAENIPKVHSSGIRWFYVSGPLGNPTVTVSNYIVNDNTQILQAKGIIVL